MKKNLILAVIAIFVFLHLSVRAEDTPSPGQQPKNDNAEGDVFSNFVKEQMKSSNLFNEKIAKEIAERDPEIIKRFGVSEEEFQAIKPLLVSVETLMMQMEFCKAPDILGGKLYVTYYENVPSLVEYRKATDVLSAIVNDAQANAIEVTGAIARLHKAKSDFAAVLEKARNDLRAVLKPKQEGVLIDMGILK